MAHRPAGERRGRDSAQAPFATPCPLAISAANTSPPIACARPAGPGHSRLLPVAEVANRDKSGTTSGISPGATGRKVLHNSGPLAAAAPRLVARCPRGPPINLPPPRPRSRAEADANREIDATIAAFRAALPREQRRQSATSEELLRSHLRQPHGAPVRAPAPPRPGARSHLPAGSDAGIARPSAGAKTFRTRLQATSQPRLHGRLHNSPPTPTYSASSPPARRYRPPSRPPRCPTADSAPGLTSSSLLQPNPTRTGRLSERSARRTRARADGKRDW
jgi:hypothetical protein